MCSSCHTATGTDHYVVMQADTEAPHLNAKNRTCVFVCLGRIQTWQSQLQSKAQQDPHHSNACCMPQLRVRTHTNTPTCLMRANVPACCCAGNAVSQWGSRTQHGTLMLSTCICCPHILGDNYTISFPLLHVNVPYISLALYVNLIMSGCLSYCICQWQHAFLDLKWLLTSMISSLLFHRTCVHGQSTLLREIHWTHDWFGGKKPFQSSIQ